MNVPNRAALISKTHKILKKHFQPVQPQSDRTVLEHLLYACCLENSLHQDADDVFAKLLESYFDWNEIRVTTTRELASAMSGLRDASDAAKRLKSTLQSVFESHYSFDLDFFRKQNQGKAVKEFERLKGTTPFSIGYLTQNALAGHSIPVNDGALQALYVLGIVTDAEAKKRRTPGMERAIPKSKGVEFASLLHQLGVEYRKSQFSTSIRAILLEIAPDAKERLPKRPSRKVTPVANKPSTTAKKTPTKATASAASKKKKSAKKAAVAPKKKAADGKPVKKKVAAGKPMKKKPR